MPKIRVHRPVLSQVGLYAGLYTKILDKAKKIAPKSHAKYLENEWGENVALLRAGDAPRYFLTHGCLALVGFEKKRKRVGKGALRTAVAHLQSGEGTRHSALTKSCVRKVVGHVGKNGVFAVAGLPSEEGARQELLKTIRSELERQGVKLSDRKVVRKLERDSLSAVLVDAKRQYLHVFEASEEK